MEPGQHRGPPRRFAVTRVGTAVTQIGTERRRRQLRIDGAQRLQHTHREGRLHVVRDDEAVVAASTEEQAPRVGERLGDVDADPMGSELLQQRLQWRRVREQGEDTQGSIVGTGQDRLQSALPRA